MQQLKLKWLITKYLNNEMIDYADIVFFNLLENVIL